MLSVKLLDCTLRDGGYYNQWDFSDDFIQDYLEAMEAISADYVEIGFRSLTNEGYRGGCGYSTDSYINSLNVPSGVKLAVMVNAAELIRHQNGVESALNKLFLPASESPVSLTRIACHLEEIEPILPAIRWLKNKGYLVALNLMQIAGQSKEEVRKVTESLSGHPLDVFYFADSLGSLTLEKTSEIISVIKERWKKDIGFHAHDNICQGLNNTITAINEGVLWVDGTVAGMGRGAGNASTEYLAIELEPHRDVKINPTKLYSLIHRRFKSLKTQYGWGASPFYYIASKKGIHPTYVQQMTKDTRYSEEDILITLNQLERAGSRKYKPDTLDSARHFFSGKPCGNWEPAEIMDGKDVLILGTGPGVKIHKKAVELYIQNKNPFVIALNTQAEINATLINIRVACHPMRLLTDCEEHLRLPQPLITPYSQLPESVKNTLKSKKIMDFGMQVKPDIFAFEKTSCVVPVPLVIAYCLAVATSGNAKRILMAGFDGYEADDPRNDEMNNLIKIYNCSDMKKKLIVITPSRYEITKYSVYAL